MNKKEVLTSKDKRLEENDMDDLACSSFLPALGIFHL